jgi:hypothetical protein
MLRHQSGDVVFKSSDEAIAGMQDELSVEANYVGDSFNDKNNNTSGGKRGKVDGGSTSRRQHEVRIEEDESGPLGRGGRSEADAHELLSWNFLEKSDRDALRVLERRVGAEVGKYYERIAQELDPDTAQAAARADKRVGELKDQLVSLRAQIDDEKASQEQILRDFRGGVNGGGGRAVGNVDTRTQRR